MSDPLRAGLNLLRRLPPREVAVNVNALCALRPDLTEEFLSRVDQPLHTQVDGGTGRRYILCDYNRDGASFRSPWTSTYDPPIPAGEGEPFQPSPALRAFEVTANELWAAYCEAYYGGGAATSSSVYAWDDGDVGGAAGGDGDGLAAGFASCWLVKKEGTGGATWDGIHVVDARPSPPVAGEPPSTTLRLTSSVLLTLPTGSPEARTGTLDLAGSLTRQAVSTVPGTGPGGAAALEAAGQMIEAMEIELRERMHSVYLGRMGGIVGALRGGGGAVRMP